MFDILAPTWHLTTPAEGLEMFGLQVGNELADFQSRDFAATLTQLHKEILSSTSAPFKAQEHPNRAKIEKLILDVTGVNIDYKLFTTYPPCCFPTIGNPNHVLNVFKLPDIYAEQQISFTDAVRNDPTKKGTFNPKTGKLGGVYSLVKAPIYMSYSFCKANFTAEEMTAVLMHEVGHCALAYMFMFRTYRASQLLAALHQVKTGRDNSVTYVDAITMLGNDLVHEPKEFQQLIEIKDDKAVAQIVYTRTWAELGNDFGDKSVTGPNFEALADNYAVRWGLGLPLTTALYSIMGDTFLGAKSRTAATVGYCVATIAPLAVGAGYGFMLGGPAGALIGMALAAIIATAVQGRGDGVGFAQTNIYDKPIVRLERIREGIIEQMKNYAIEPALRDVLLGELKVLDGFLKNRTDVSNLFADIAKIFPGNYKAEIAFELERNLERLTQNSLFVDAHELAKRISR